MIATKQLQQSSPQPQTPEPRGPQTPEPRGPQTPEPRTPWLVAVGSRDMTYTIGKHSLIVLLGESPGPSKGTNGISRASQSSAMSASAAADTFILCAFSTSYIRSKSSPNPISDSCFTHAHTHKHTHTHKKQRKMLHISDRSSVRMNKTAQHMGLELRGERLRIASASTTRLQRRPEALGPRFRHRERAAFAHLLHSLAGLVVRCLDSLALR